VNFDQPFFTHGIDVLTEPEEQDYVYIYAANHLPSPELLSYLAEHHPDRDTITHSTVIPDEIPRARSQLEIFRHKIGSGTATHLRSVRHPLLRTPNDILARGDGRSVYVTNDHFYRAGQMRSIEDIWHYARWTDTVHLQIEDLESKNDTAGFTASVALTGLHNNNGLGRGASEGELVITSAASGDVHIATPRDNDGKLDVKESFHLESSLDNPSYLVDQYAPSPEDDRSGYVIAGLTKAADLLQSAHDPNATEPVVVWLVRKGADGDNSKRNVTVLFEDDGRRIRSASGAVVKAIDPALEDGRRRVWLFVTGFFSRDMIAVKIDL
jgi:hypothetical protein